MRDDDLFARVTSQTLDERSGAETIRRAAAEAFGEGLDDNAVGLFTLALTGSLDALAPLIERYRPEVKWSIEATGSSYVARVQCPRGDNPAKARTPGRALLLSYLRSLRGGVH
ncbi:MAG TPA: hypothetical protein VGU70_20105 [Methylobacterium sp.]|jgi:hypothetical protein|nr:hypothetical protein [Methylobacterium sp.]